MAMRAGQLRHLLTVQAPVVRREVDGGQLISWETVSTVWAQVSPLRHSEQLLAAQVQGRETHRVTVRGTELPSTYRLVMENGRVLEPTGVRDIDERGIMLEILAVEKT